VRSCCVHSCPVSFWFCRDQMWRVPGIQLWRQCRTEDALAAATSLSELMLDCCLNVQELSDKIRKEAMSAAAAASRQVIRPIAVQLGWLNGAVSSGWLIGQDGSPSIPSSHARPTWVVTISRGIMPALLIAD